MGAKKVIDIATLTGAVIIALGNETSGIVANDDELVEQIKLAGRMAGENYWQLLPCQNARRPSRATLRTCSTAQDVPEVHHRRSVHW